MHQSTRLSVTGGPHQAAHPCSPNAPVNNWHAFPLRHYWDCFNWPPNRADHSSGCFITLYTNVPMLPTWNLCPYCASPEALGPIHGHSPPNPFSATAIDPSWLFSTETPPLKDLPSSVLLCREISWPLVHQRLIGSSTPVSLLYQPEFAHQFKLPAPNLDCFGLIPQNQASLCSCGLTSHQAWST
jgi:hypothetical protein